MTLWMDRLIASSPRLIGMSPSAYLRLAATGLALSSVLLGGGTATLGWLPWPFLWASFYGASATLLLLLALRPSSGWLSARAGASTIIAHIMRGGILALGKALNLRGVGQFPWWQIVVGVAAFWTVAFICTLLFFTRVEFVASVERTRR